MGNHMTPILIAWKLVGNLMKLSQPQPSSFFLHLQPSQEIFEECNDRNRNNRGGAGNGRGIWWNSNLSGIFPAEYPSYSRQNIGTPSTKPSSSTPVTKVDDKSGVIRLHYKRSEPTCCLITAFPCSLQNQWL